MSPTAVIFMTIIKFITQSGSIFTFFGRTQTLVANDFVACSKFKACHEYDLRRN